MNKTLGLGKHKAFPSRARKLFKFPPNPKKKKIPRNKRDTRCKKKKKEEVREKIAYNQSQGKITSTSIKTPRRLATRRNEKSSQEKTKSVSEAGFGGRNEKNQT